MVGAPGHGKYIVNTVNAYDTQYLRSKICMVGIEAHCMVRVSKSSLAKECKRLFEDNIRSNGTNS